jgi:hypothetical protein
MFRLRAQKNKAEMDSPILKEEPDRVKQLQDSGKEPAAGITEFDESRVRKLTEKITSFPRLLHCPLFVPV